MEENKIQVKEMSEKILFKIIPEKPPKAERIGKKGSKYDEILKRFVESNVKNGKVILEIPKDPKVLAIALRNRIKANNFKVSVVQRGSDIYLVKT